MSENPGLLTYDERQARWRALVAAWPCPQCPCPHNHRGIVRAVCQTCSHVHQPQPSRKDMR